MMFPEEDMNSFIYKEDNCTLSLEMPEMLGP